MEIHLSIYTYGHYEAMFYILNGIALIMNSPFADSLIKLMITSTMAYYGFCMAYSGAEGRSKDSLIKIISMSVIVGALIIPKTSIDIEDRVTGYKETVSNLPVAFAVPVGILEAFGGAITSGFEQAFTPVGSLAYKDYGMIFGARLVRESQNWRITNPEFAHNMDSFLRRCVVLESMIGNRFTPQDIITSEDILTLVKQHAGTFRKVDFKQGKKTYRYSCRESADKLQDYLQEEIFALIKRYTTTDFGRAGSKKSALGSIENLNNQLKNNIEIAYSGMLGTSVSAEQIMRQSMIINAIHDYSNKTDLYGYSRALNHQESSWMIGGELASEYLPILLSVLKGLVYASFTFIVPLMIIGGGMNRYINYLIVIVSLQLWPALNAVLNLFVELYTSEAGRGITKGILTYATFGQLHKSMDKIVAVASGLQWMLPLLSLAIAKGGMHAFINLASNVGNVSQSSASMVAGEVTAGVRNFDNISMGNIQRAQQIAHKVDYNASYSEGASSYQLMDGTTERVIGSGSTILTGGAGQTISSGGARYNLEESVMNQISEGFNRTSSLVESEQIAYNDARTSTMSKVSNLVSSIAQREVTGHTYNYEAMGEHGKALQTAVNHTKELHNREECSWSNSASASVKAYVDAGVSSSIPFVRGEVGVRGEAGLETSSSSNKSASIDERVTDSFDSSENLSNIIRATSNEQWMRENNVDISYARDIRGSYEDMQSISKNLSMHQEEAQSYNTAMNKLNNMSGSSSRDMYHLVERRLIDDYKVSQYQAHNMIENNDSRAQIAWNNIVNENVSDLMNPIHEQGDKIKGKNAEQQLQNFTDFHAKKVTEEPLSHVDRSVSHMGLDGKESQIKALKKRVVDKFIKIQQRD